MATIVAAFPQTAFPVGVTKSPPITPPVGTNVVVLKGAAVAFRGPAGVGTHLELGIDISFDAGATWRHGVSAGYDGGGPVVDKHATVIDWVDIGFKLGAVGGPSQADPTAQPVPILSDANTRLRGSVTVTGAVLLGPGTLTFS